MGLKTIFQMTKTDRYTQDGRDELAKLQETEDVRYKTGDISQKTGLQKQPDGSWAPPKKGAKPGAGKQAAGSINRTPERIAKETAIMEALNLSTGEDNNLHKMSDETIERLYAKTQEASKPAEKSNGTIAQQKQKMESEKYEAARRDAQAPSKKTEVNTPGLRKDVQEAIKRSSPEEIKAYIKELRTPGSRMSRYFDNPDLLANVYEDELNKITESKLTDKYKDLPGAQKKDALFASTFEGISIGQTQNQMERQGWELISTGEETGENVNVYAKPDGSKVTMKHDGNKITSTEYEAPGSAESKAWAERSKNERTATLVDWLDDWDKHPEEKNDAAYAAIEKELASRGVNRAGRQNAKKADNAGRNEFYRRAYESDAAPRILTGDTKIRIRK